MLYLRKPIEKDVNEIKALYKKSVSLHSPWSYPPKNFDSYLSEQNRYFLCHENTREIIGTFNISGVVRGYFQSAYLGYEIFTPHEGQGFMRIGLSLILNEAFVELNLHRLEANIQPGNIASIKLVEGAGFKKEGFSESYLNIGNKGWQDHERWALINKNWREKKS
jgi:ribosomal-protein-alanine N-acetyltransferase